ncbi:hypothetical protein EGW08_007075 [Elysia chlorotica]|uniref:EGF-like domain-containing protein n=1 Tax=Elysia chlorotica TaxID=188477 RepID=A0A433TUD4_ELYCH|nr:hypothetical protein EGW08_007075 [Elysia chlorotica]
MSGMANQVVLQGRKRGRRHKPHTMSFLRTTQTTLFITPAKAVSFLLLNVLLAASPVPTLSQELAKTPQDGFSKGQGPYPTTITSTTTANKDAPRHQNDFPKVENAVTLEDYENTWTFSQPGVSYLAFSPAMRGDQAQHYSLAFRTRRPHGLLFQQHVPDLVDSAFASVLTRYQLFVELRQGSLRAGFIMNQYEDFIKTGKALNNDAWHTVELVVDVKQRELRISLDGHRSRETLKAYTWGNAEEILLWNHLKPLVSLGDSRMGDSSQNFQPFVGCLRAIEYATPEGYLSRPSFETREGVTNGCLDRCQSDRSCGPGRCINLYTPEVRCDCYGTDLEGPRCDLQALTSITLRGYEWVNYELYDKETGRLFTDNMRISLNFKTERGSGVLLYAVGGSPFHNHVTVSIHSGAVHVSVSFQEDDLAFSLGIGLDDGRWHNLTVHHHQDRVTVYLDGLPTEKRVSRGDHYLSLDSGIYIGGGNNFVQTKGLPVTQNFVGCLRNVYINEVSVLYELAQGNSRSVYNGGEKPRYGCHSVAEVPISFPRSSSLLRWSSRERKKTLTVEFKVRTFHQNAIVMSMELVSRQNPRSDLNFGSIQLWIIDQYPVLQLIPFASEEHTKQNMTVDLIISDGQLHDIQVTLNNSEVKLQVDGATVHSRRYYRVLESKGNVILGYSLGLKDRRYGFVGCMQGIQIQGQRLDAIAVVESDDAVGLVLDGCQLVDHCSRNNICEHGSTCLSDWDGIHCVCREDHYEGKACHFAKYASSCEEYYRMGYRTSGVYLIDVDGSGPLDHTYVQCEMEGHMRHGRGRRGAIQAGVTRVEHNFEANTTVRAPWLPALQYNLKYRDMSRAHLVKLTEISSHCEQYLEYGCQNAPLWLSHKTWFRSTTGKVVDYIGSSQKSGTCTCPPDTHCGGENCYCDLNRDSYLSDRGYNRDRKHLPLVEMTFIQTRPAGIAHMTLGPLKCWGSATQSAEESVTITQPGNFLKLHPWLNGDLRLNFKTHSVHSVLLYQAPDHRPQKSGPQTDAFYVIIDSDYSIIVYFLKGTNLIRRRVQAPSPLSEGNWHSLVLEWDFYNMRISLDSTRVLLELPDGFWSSSVGEHSDQEGKSLYLGGLPVGVPVGELELQGMQGFTGCLYGLMYNGSPVDLPSLLDVNALEISKGCMSSCWPNPCQNGGICQENWVSFTCQCSNPWAHMGKRCEIDITKDGVTFSGLPGSSLQFDLINKQPEALSATVVLGFRTLESEALLLYMHDQFGNFVQLELSDARTITISFNNLDRIVREMLSTDEPLNDGEWKQVVAENYHNFTRLIVESHSRVIEIRRGRLQTYKLNPYTNSDLQTVIIDRPSTPFINAYVGGVKRGASTTSALSGCLRGLRVGNFVFPLQDSASSLKNGTLVTPVCEKGCQKMACHNNGFCVEKWKNGQFQCNCDKSGFSGQRCEIEPSVLVKGNTVVHHTFQLPRAERYSSSERFSFRFKADRRRPEARNKEIVLIYISSSKDNDYVMIKFLQNGHMQLETNQGTSTFRMNVNVQFEDGLPHDFSYIRDGSNMHVKVDGVEEVGINYPDYPLNFIDSIYIGGYITDSLAFLNLANFSGCISNTAFVPKAGENSRTLHTLRDLYIEKEGISVLGDATSVCSTSQDYLPTSIAPPISAHITPGSFMEATMPPWTDRELQVVTLSAVPTPKQGFTSAPLTPHTTSTKGSGNGTYPVLFNTSQEPVGDITIIIAVVVVALLLIISLCLILVLVRMRKRRGDYLVKKEKDGADGTMDSTGKEADMELRQPLNNHHTNLGASSCSNRSSPDPKSPTYGPHTATLRRVIHPPTVPNDHLAKLDEFSMISVALGPRVPKEDAHPPDEAKKRYGEGSYPLADGEMEFISPIYNARKQRPASSISEVLEEMERRQTPLSNGSLERPGRLHGEGELEWDSQADASAPMRNEDEAMLRSPLLPIIPDDLEESRFSSFSGHQSSSLAGDSSYQKCMGPLESSSSPAGSSQMNSTAECNGDSGYEAESRREATEDDITPETLADEIADLHFRPPKLYSFMVPDLRVDDLANSHANDIHSPGGIFTAQSHDGGFVDNSFSGGIFNENSLGRMPFKGSDSSGLLMEESPDLSRMSARERLLQEGTEV